MIIVDKGFLFQNPSIIGKEEIAILVSTLQELDEDKSERAKQIRFLIRKHNKNIQFIDHSILAANIVTAARQNEINLIGTTSLYYQIKAIREGFQLYQYDKDNAYIGIKYLKFELDENGYNSELDKILSSYEENFLELKNNQYLILHDNKENYLGSYVYRNGNLNQVKITAIKNQWVNKIWARNPEQECLFDALQNQQSTILYIGGRYGLGKTLLSTSYAIQQLEREAIRKIICIPNNSYTANSMNIGARPGDTVDKTLPQIGPLIDLVGIDQIYRWVSEEKLEIVPISDIRGRSFADSIVLVNEAQNLTEDHVKLLIARCGENTRIFFDGDYRQTDQEIFKDKSGLKLLLKLSDSPVYSQIFSAVTLRKSERSLTASAVDYLDTIQYG